MQVEIIEGLPATADALAAVSPETTFFQTRSWLERFARAVPGSALRSIVARRGEEALGYLPYFQAVKGGARSCVSLPFGCYGGPVAPAPEVRDRLCAEFERFKAERDVHAVFLADFHGRLGSRLPMTRVTTHVIDLSEGFERIWSERFDKSKRRQTRKGRREGIEVALTREPDAVAAYYRIYRDRNAAWGQSDVFPEQLFHDLVADDSRSVRLYVALDDGKIVGGHVNFYFADTVTAWTGVTDGGASALQASTVLYAECIRNACEEGFKRYNLGGSLDKETLVEYKEALGGVAYSYPVYHWRSLAWRLANTIRRMLKPSAR